MLYYFRKNIYFFKNENMYPLKIKEKYHPNTLEKTAHKFTVVYLWTYISWDVRENVGSHPGVDIIPEIPNQNVYNILDGIVFKTGEDGAYGKYIIIEHKNAPHPDDLSKTTTLYSSYQHLSDVKVSVWQVVLEGSVIGKTGNTGNSFWEHLHFQIDKQEAPFHAYWPFTGAEVKSEGTTFSWGVNMWLGREKAQMYTINPLFYLDKVDEYRKNGTITPITTPEKKEILSPTKEEIIEIKHEETPIIKEEKSVLDTLLSSDSSDISVAPKTLETHLENQPETKEETPIIKEHKIEILWSDENIIVSNPTLDFLAGNISSEKKKFKDISSTDPYFSYITNLVDKWFLTGYGDGTFQPKNPITRTEFLKLLFLVSWTELSNDTRNYFTDIKVWWQKKYINTAISLGMVSRNNTKFNPNGFVSRAEALKMMILLFIGEIPNFYRKELNDVSGSEWYAKYVEYALNYDLLPISNNNFSPNKPITRYEIIGMLKKITEK